MGISMPLRYKPAFELPAYCAPQMTKGRLYIYVRYKGQRVRLSALPGTEEFTAEYRKVIEQLKGPVGIKLALKGSVRAMVVGYLAGSEFKGLSATTQERYRKRIEIFAGANGNCLVSGFGVDYFRTGLAEIESISERSILRNALASLFSWGAAQHPPLVARNPFIEIPSIKAPKGKNHRRWMPEHVEAFRKAHPDFGSVERRAFEFIMSTGARGRSDVRRFERRHIRDGQIAFVAQKNGYVMDGIPVSPLLARCVAAHPATDLVFFRGRDGGQMTDDVFGKMFKKACATAGLDADLTPHGLRHAMACEAAERGESALTIQRLLGDRKIDAALEYVKQADDTRMRREAHKRRWEAQA